MKKQVIVAIFLGVVAVGLAGCGQSPKDQLETSVKDLFSGLQENDAERVMRSIPEGANLQHLTREDVRERTNHGLGLPATFKNVPKFSSQRHKLQKVKVVGFEPENKRAQVKVVFVDGITDTVDISIEKTNDLWHVSFE